MPKTKIPSAQSILNNLVESAISIDERGIIQYVNQITEKIFGYTSSELIGQNVSILMPEPQARQHNGYIQNYLNTGLAKIIGIGREVVARKKDGTEFPVHLSVSEGKSDDKCRFFTGIIRDMSEQKKIEQEILTLRNELIHISRMTLLGEFSAALSHETNQPLTSILINAQTAQRLMDKKSIDLAEIRSIITDIIADSIRAGEIIARLRAMVSTVKPNLLRVDLRDCIEELIKFSRDHLVLNGTSVKFQCDRSVQWVKADKVLLQQVILNCITNACDAMHDTKGRKEINVLVQPSAPDRLLISIRDTGPGFKLASNAIFFKAFYTTKKTGMGMGLSISRRIVEAHDGRIWIENQSGGGATVFVELPVPKELQHII